METLLEDLSNAIGALNGSIEERAVGIRLAATYAARLEPAVPGAELDAYANILDEVIADLKAFQDDHSQIENAIAALENECWKLPASAQKRLDETQKGVKSLPDSSAKEKAIDFLAILQDRYQRLLTTTTIAKSMSERNLTAQKSMTTTTLCPIRSSKVFTMLSPRNSRSFIRLSMMMRASSSVS